MDGIGGPYFTGTGYYLKRKAFYGTPNHEGMPTSVFKSVILYVCDEFLTNI